jgi:hypothetical protein
MKQQKPVLFKIPVLFFLFASIAHSQDDSWLNYNSTETLRSMNLEYRHPKDFTGSYSTECFDEYPDLEKRSSCWSMKIQSNDGHFIAFLYFETNSLPQDSVWHKTNPALAKDMIHIMYIKKDLAATLEKEEANQWQKHVQYYLEKEAKSKFNADTAIIYSLKLSEPYKNKYNHCKTLIIQKKSRGFVSVQCFYDDMAAEKNSGYMNDMEGIFKYGEKQPDFNAKYGMERNGPEINEDGTTIYTIRVEDFIKMIIR